MSLFYHKTDIFILGIGSTAALIALLALVAPMMMMMMMIPAMMTNNISTTTVTTANTVIIIKTKVLFTQAWVTVADFRSTFKAR
jgi:hypothetical protein